jgi:hypothetical protein
MDVKTCFESRFAGQCSKCGVDVARPHVPIFRHERFCAACCVSCHPRPAAAQVAPTSPKRKPGSDFGGPPGAERDPFYRDTAEDRRRRSVARRNGGRAWVQSAGFIGPDGNIRPVAAPDYEPRPFIPAVSL